MECHVAVSTDSHANLAGRSIARSIKAALGHEPIDLAFLFFSSHFSEEIEELVATVHHELSPVVLAGCMGEGVIGETEEFEGSTAVILWAARLPKVDLLPLRLYPDEQDGKEFLRGWPEELVHRSDKPTIILFADPFTTPFDEVFLTIERQCPGSPVIGGIACGGMDLGENRLVLNGDIYETGLVGVALWGAVTIRTVVSQGCQPIGERFVVTRAERNIIYELGGIPALERLQSAIQSLGEDDRQKAAMAVQIGLAMDEHRTRFDRGDFLIRGLMGADRSSGSVAVSDVVEEGRTVQFHIRDIEAASEDLNMLLAAERIAQTQNPPKGALLFSCNGRGRRFFPQPHHDVTVLRDRIGKLPVGGFFAGGEIGPVGGRNYLHGYTASMAFFCESTDFIPN